MGLQWADLDAVSAQYFYVVFKSNFNFNYVYLQKDSKNL